MSRARYIMIGGFLGAGKTTAILRFARQLSDRGLRVGLITNDQGAGLVDTAMARSREFPTGEISGGCFCCRFNSLIEAAAALSDDAENCPDVFLAEPVGSCTDLVATVSLPLQRIYGESYRVAPMSVLVDPVRCRRILGLDTGRKFSPNVQYIYRKQLEEAELIAINKIDLLSDAERGELRDALTGEFPDARVLEVCARDGRGLDPWFGLMMDSELHSARFMEVDYQLYGEGEALLGWLNGTVHLESEQEFDGNALLEQLAARLADELERAGAEVAHLKMTLTPIGDPLELGAVNLVRGGERPELSHRLCDPLEDGELLLNMRAEAAPELLESAAAAALRDTVGRDFGLDFKVRHLEHFRPGQPVPTHRMAGV